MSLLPDPNDLDVESLGNWIDNNKPLIREESDFVNHKDDLFALAPRTDVGTLDRFVHTLLRTRIPDKFGQIVGMLSRLFGFRY
jgi:hypothetical protein